MKFSRRIFTILLTVLVMISIGAPTNPASASSREPHNDPRVAYDWQRTALRTVYTEAALPTPSGSLYVAFASLAARDAVRAASKGSGPHHRRASAEAAVAAAAHGVLTEYFPASAARLDADLEASLAAIPDGKAQARGIRIGERAAARMIASRAEDGRNAPITYVRPPAPGVWQPPVTGMTAPWLGFVDPLRLRRPVPVDGPDALTSAAYAADFAEVKRVGSATAAASDRSAHDTETAKFFNSNVVVQLREGLIGYLETRHYSLDRVTRLFAANDAATADSLIQGWRIKYEVGFWRPFQAIAQAGSDGNEATTPDLTWTSLLPTPPYPDYLSGHALVVSSTTAILRSELGDRVPLTLSSTVTGTQRTYPTLSLLERDAFNARIWLGFHFRDAMEDGYELGHETARRVERRVH